MPYVYRRGGPYQFLEGPYKPKKEHHEHKRKRAEEVPSNSASGRGGGGGGGGGRGGSLLSGGFTTKPKFYKYVNAEVLLDDSIYPGGPPPDFAGRLYHYHVVRYNG